MEYSKPLQFNVEEHYSGVAPHFSDVFGRLLNLCQSSILRDSVSLRCFLYPIILVPINLISPPAVSFCTEYFSSLLLPPSQTFWDMLLPSISGWANIFHEIVKCLPLKIWYVFYFLLWLKYWLMRTASHCIQSFFIHIFQRSNFLGICN